MSRVTDATSLAKNVYEQGGNLNTRLGSNCLTIGEVIQRALQIGDDTATAVGDLQHARDLLAQRSLSQLDSWESENAYLNAGWRP